MNQCMPLGVVYYCWVGARRPMGWSNADGDDDDGGDDNDVESCDGDNGSSGSPTTAQIER